MQTGDNDRFLRFWYEVELLQVNGYSNAMPVNPKRWFLYSKGGEFRKWYGNVEHVVDWSNDGYQIRNFSVKGSLRSRVREINNYFKDGISWSFVSSSYFATSFKKAGVFFDVAGSSFLPSTDLLPHILVVSQD